MSTKRAGCSNGENDPGELCVRRMVFIDDDGMYNLLKLVDDGTGSGVKVLQIVETSATKAFTQ